MQYKIYGAREHDLYQHLCQLINGEFPDIPFEPIQYAKDADVVGWSRLRKAELVIIRNQLGNVAYDQKTKMYTVVPNIKAVWFKFLMDRHIITQYMYAVIKEI